MSSQRPSRPTRRRPFTLIALAGLMVIKALLLVTVVVGAAVSTLPGVTVVLTLPRIIFQIQAAPGAEVMLSILAGLLIVSAVLLLARRRTGWLLAMVMAGVFVASDIAAFLGGQADHIWMALNIITVFYLNQPAVRDFFGASRPRRLDEEGVA